MALPTTLGALRAAVAAGRVPHRAVKDELRENLIAHAAQRRVRSSPASSATTTRSCRRSSTPILSRAQLHPARAARSGEDAAAARAGRPARRRRFRSSPGCEIHDDPLAPLCAACRARVATEGDDLPIALAAARAALRREARDAGRHDRRHDRRRRSDQGRARRPRARRRADDALRPAAARAIAASSRSTSCRTWRARCRSACSTSCRRATSRSRATRCGCAWTSLLVFSANPEDYTARGKIITPLKDRIGSEIRTHYPRTAAGRAGDHGAGSVDGRGRRRGRRVPVRRCRTFVREIVEEIAFQARARSESRPAIGREPAAADHDARERRLERRAARAAARRAGRRAARERRLRGAAVAHRQDRARVRGRAQGRRRRRARARARGRRDGLRRPRGAGGHPARSSSWFERGGTLELVRHGVGRASCSPRSTRSTASIGVVAVAGAPPQRDASRCARRPPTSCSKVSAR